MSETGTVYCEHCGTANLTDSYYCVGCGRRVSERPAKSRRIAGLAFLLNEASTARFKELIGDEGAAAVSASYEAELFEITGQRPSEAPEPAPQPEPQPVAPVTAPPAPPRRREPRDWSWLAEHQANLFLFAGAFLVVVAALIYVAYSGQAISGALKMSLLIAYTLAFLAAGVLCLHIPRVRVAGEVFFGVGALLVPLNFVAAYNIFSDQDLSATAMWLAGSLTTAIFYTAVASTGLGKHYAYSAGVAIFSAGTAAAAVAALPFAWVPAALIAVALALSLVDLAATSGVRARITSAWLLEAQAVAPVATFVAIVTAVVVATPDMLDGTSRWFLLPTATPALAFYAVETAVRGQRYAVFAAAGALSLVGGAFVYGLDVPVEHYALAFIGVGVAAYAVALWPMRRLASADAAAMRTDARLLAQVNVTGGVGVAILSALIATNPEYTYTQQTAWSLLIAFVAGAAFFAWATLTLTEAGDRRLASLAFAAASVGAATAVVYGAGWSGEYYAYAFAAAALGLFALSLPIPRVPVETGAPVVRVAHLAAAAAGAVIVGAVYVAAADTAYELQTRWSLPALFGLLAVFYALAAMRQPTDTTPGRATSLAALLASIFGIQLGIVYALDVSAEYYAFAFIVPSLALGALTHVRSARLASMLPQYRQIVLWTGRLAILSGVAVAVGAVAAAASPELSYEPDARAFLPVAFALAAAFFALDAAAERRYLTSAAAMTFLAGAALGITYAAEADAPWYGVTLAATGALAGLGRRAWSPGWLDSRASEHAAVIVVTVAWLPFEAVYADFPRIAAGVHFAAAVFYAVSAFSERRVLPAASRVQDREAAPLPVAPAWLYAAGLALSIGYVHVLRATPSAEDAAAHALAFPLLGLSIAMLVAGAVMRRWRADFTPHLYVMALLLDVAAIAAAGGEARDLALVLTISVAASAAIAVWERQPLLAIPAAVFGFGAVAAWRQVADWPLYAIPMTYSAIALAMYALGFALHRRERRWSDALRAAGGAYALIAPAVGFVTLANGTTDGLFDGAAFETSPLYQWATLGVALVGALAVVESTFARRGWVIVAGSGVLVAALLLEFGYLQVREVQAYTATIGVYVLLAGALGLWRFRLIPSAAGAAPYLEALGAAIVMVPSLIRSLDGGWSYLIIVLAETVGFFTLGVVLKRRGLIATAMTAFVLIAGRVLFDAVQALPNWIIVLIAGMGLLAVGVGILLGRERWSRWQDAVLGWWNEMSAPEPGSGQPPHGLGRPHA